MSLENLYSLRTNFLIVGLTGRTGGGANDICKFLQQEINPFNKEIFELPLNLHVNEIQKFTICQNLLTDASNVWCKFSVIKYSDVLMLFFFRELRKNVKENFENLDHPILMGTLNKIYNKKTVVTRRLGQDEKSDKLHNKILDYLKGNVLILNSLESLSDLLSNKLEFYQYAEEIDQHIKYLNKIFFEKFSDFTRGLFSLIDSIDPVARQLFLQDIACNLRACGNIYFEESKNINSGPEHIFTVAVVINNLIKINRQSKLPNRIVIDSLKNSLEINYFRERYAGFYLIASAREESEADNYIMTKIKKMGFNDDQAVKKFKDIKLIDEAHYQTKDFKVGKFTTPDVENCIQKADYYVYFGKKLDFEPEKYIPENFLYLNLHIQLLKFLALVQKPGIVTPSAIERSMQLAFSSKYNSGCISRQVGAVVTDSNYSVKSIGWNEVPQGQTPCSLRSLKELMETKRTQVYSDYEKNGGNYSGQTFKEKVRETLTETYGSDSEFFNNLNGHNCPYCFKDFHNSFEGKENQVHTRSLHAEENAMLQISKFGGQPLNKGILFTTASPCELCSKKAFQLGITKIFYIDPYPGIARQQILKAGNNEESNPKLFMFQGAVGRGYFKLYEPYMSIKDETYIRTGIKAKVSNDKKIKDLKEQLLEEFPNSQQINSLSSYEDILNIIRKGLDS
ncbi:hypothetical protein [Sphingobacterium multivorum]|uniref:ComE operon protein 2 n=1 Tax=Sphingobacterium multivorum TaxID=28454 RepID=A0A653XZP3_SPHMU|nr:hypothetical protein [Sphingobacterium multivorum]QQT45436.1 hypothetical protein I6J00_01740 [Sphingobacterium multivorum]SUJ25217.1 ComE operon protein 2 [Sphingobacterium multivorum]VXC35217.1 ComE operon protein 2 [Sphingobacterium multivorum]